VYSSERHVTFDPPPIVTLVDGHVTELDGDSFGLSFALAHVSSGLGLPIPAHIAASATIDARGQLGGVLGLREKIEHLLTEALGIERMLVHASQMDEARSLVRELRERHGLTEHLRPFEIEAVHRLEHAVRMVFPDAKERMRERWASFDIGRSAAADLIRLAHGQSVQALSWEAVEEACRDLAAFHADRFSARERDALSRAERIARRHRGGSSIELGWPDQDELASKPRLARAWLVAHVVQSCADGRGPAEDFAIRALEMVEAEPLERSKADAILLGAIGRALASVGRSDEALAHLEAALRTWADIDEREQASFALCEALRLRGARCATQPTEAEVEKLDLLVEAAGGYADLPSAPELSVAFVAVAAGRALVQAKRLDEARRWLNIDQLGLPVPPHLEAARLRWSARALAEASKQAESASLYGMLDELLGDADQKLLANIDRAIQEGRPVEPLEADLRPDATAPLDDLYRTLRQAPGGGEGERLAWLREWSRY
jgi:tetratricopeptide (TPR) repeat protein